MPVQLYPVLPRIADINLAPSPGAKLYFYESGTTTPLTVFTTEAVDIPHPSPIIAASDGSVPAVWIPSGSAKVVVTDASDATLFTIDPVVASSGSGLSAADVGFSPTVALPQTNAQAAIEAAAASAASGFTPFGLGITGNATLLADIDATNIGAGTYRFDGTATGTYPTGVVAADGGIIEHWRQSSGAAMQMLYHATTDRIFHRRMASSTWGTWRENITTNQGAAEGDVIYRGATAWTRLAKGTARQVLRMNAGATAPEWSASEWTYTSPVTLSGSSNDWTGIPSGITSIRMFFNTVSVTPGSHYGIRVGSSGGFLTTGYTSVSGSLDGGGAGTTNASTQFIIFANDAADGMFGYLDLTKGDANFWAINGNVVRGGARTASCMGLVDLGATLTQVQLRSTTGSTFDAGTAYIAYR